MARPKQGIEMSSWQVLKSEEVYKTPWIRIRRDEVLNHAGKPLTYSVIELNHPSVFIVAANAEGKILLQQNYRYTINRRQWEIPAGHSDGEDLLEAAKRELAEETGLVSDDWTHLGSLHQAVGIGNIPLEAFLARNVRKAKDAQKDEEEITNQQFKSTEEIELMAQKGVFNNAPTLGVLYLAKLHGL